MLHFFFNQFAKNEFEALQISVHTIEIIFCHKIQANSKKVIWQEKDQAQKIPITCTEIIVSQRSSLELASWSQKAGSSPQNLWPILYDIGASQVATQLRQLKNV